MRYRRCSNCFTLSEWDGKAPEFVRCPDCKKGWLRSIKTRTTPEAVEQARIEREQFNKSKKKYNKKMQSDPVIREVERSYDERLADGFSMLEGE